MVQYFPKREEEDLNGIFCSIKDNLRFSILPTQIFNGLQDPLLYVCERDPHNIFPDPSNSKSFIAINTNGYYVKPELYALKGRTVNSEYLLRNWEFKGLNQNNEWITLHSEPNKLIDRSKYYDFPIETNEWFHEFRIELKGTDNSGNYFICLDSIEVFGFLTQQKIDIYHNTCKNMNQRSKNLFINVWLLSI